MLTLYGVGIFNKDTNEFLHICGSGRNDTPAVYTTLGSARREASRRNGLLYTGNIIFKVIFLYCGKALDI